MDPDDWGMEDDDDSKTIVIEDEMKNKNFLIEDKDIVFYPTDQEDS